MAYVGKPPMGTLIFTENDCVKKFPTTIKPVGIVVHSTGANNPNINRYAGPDDGILGKNRYVNHWNQPDFKKCVHGFIGKVKDGSVMFYQTMPWNLKGWGVGSGSKGSYNGFKKDGVYSGYIQFEICEDGLKDLDYFNKIKNTAVWVCAWLCQEHNLPVSEVIGHYEAHARGYANNHGDPRNWFGKSLFNYSMDKFRADVKALMEKGCPDGEQPDIGGDNMNTEKVIETGIVSTKSDPNINLWNYPTKPSPALIKIPRGAKVNIYSNDVYGYPGWTYAEYNGKKGYADGQYLINREPVQPADPPVEPPVAPPEGLEGPGVWIPCADNEAARSIDQALQLLGCPQAVVVEEAL